MLFRSCLLIIILSFLVSACGGSVSPTPPPPGEPTIEPLPTSPPNIPTLGQPFEVRGGERVNLQDEKLWVKFIAVLEDSRCPRTVVCVWAGQVRLTLLVEMENGSSESIELGTLSPNDVSSFNNYQIKLVAVSPVSMTPEDTIAFEDYAITLVITRG